MTATTLPAGRPGNLTSEQEVKLKEFWQQTFETFGISDPSSHTANNTAEPAAVSSPDLSVDDPKKKARKSWFSRKDKDDGADADGSAASGDDKHGLNKEYKKAVAQHKPDEFRAAFWAMVKHDDPDALLLRFLRARKWVVPDALVMMVATLHWRMTEMKVDEEVMSLGETGFIDRAKNGTATGDSRKDAEDFMAQLRMGKSLLHGMDREGRPISIVRVRKHQPGQQTERALEMYTVFVIETTRLLLSPPVDTATIVFDMTSFSMSNMDYTPVKFMIKCFEANYPESLGSVLVYNAPWVFQGIWKIIRGWLDPVVASKVHFCNDVAQLSEFIDTKRIPKELGGDEAWEYKYVEPAQGEDERMKDTATREKIVAERKIISDEYEKLTSVWIKEGKRQAGDREGLAKRLRENYWRLDPYVRARSLYDRSGMIGEGGKVDLHPAEKTGPTATTGADDVD